MSHGIRQLLRVGRNTGDLDRAVAFHCAALGFRLDSISNQAPAWSCLPGAQARPSRHALLSLGAQQIALTEFADANPYPAASTSCDACFQHCAIVVDDMRSAYRRVMLHGATPISQCGPQLLPPSTGSVTAFKFRDPDGHPLELIHFPAGSGDPAWQQCSPARSTLGVDHSAIVVSELEPSIRFYQLLGLHVAARCLNHGIEQQRLDDLPDAEVDVVTLVPGARRTPHLELLRYRNPRGCGAAAAGFDATAADRVIWQAGSIDVLLDAVADADFAGALVSSGRSGGTTTALLRDPDGHLLVLREPGPVTS